MSAIDDTYDIAIIGAGPAGLAAAAALHGTGLRVLVVEAGKHVLDRNRYSSSDAVEGDGGAGLFSDGKFSSFPSATKLWQLPRGADLEAAYEEVTTWLDLHGLSTPSYPSDATGASAPSGESWMLKEFPSLYMPLAARYDLVTFLVSRAKADITRARLHEWSYDAIAGSFTCFLTSSVGPTVARARRLILATGRFGGLHPSLHAAPREFRRLEIGFRIEQPSSYAFFQDVACIDPKFILSDDVDRLEWRTFCACREGEAVLTETEGLWTYSGRADCGPTGRTNIGFNTRILDPERAPMVWEHLRAAIQDPRSAFNLPLAGLVEGDPHVEAVLDNVVTPFAREAMQRGVRQLAESFPAVTTAARLIGPTVEGVGWYPSVLPDLRLCDAPAWAVGDLAGQFRGIVAALVSGAYGARQAAQSLSCDAGEQR